MGRSRDPKPYRVKARLENGEVVHVSHHVTLGSAVLKVQNVQGIRLGRSDGSKVVGAWVVQMVEGRPIYRFGRGHLTASSVLCYSRG